MEVRRRLFAVQGVPFTHVMAKRRTRKRVRTFTRVASAAAAIAALAGAASAARQYTRPPAKIVSPPITESVNVSDYASWGHTNKYLGETDMFSGLRHF